MTVDTDDRAADPVAGFFADLEARGTEPLLSRATGTLRFDLSGDQGVEHWYVTVTKGNVQVSRDSRDADFVMGMARDLFEAMTQGRVNAMAAFLRGEVQEAGDISLVMAFQRLFPGPPGSAGPDTPARRQEMGR